MTLPQWEYIDHYVLGPRSLDRLNELGRLGWEAYGSVPLGNGTYKALLRRIIPGSVR